MVHETSHSDMAKVCGVLKFSNHWEWALNVRELAQRLRLSPRQSIKVAMEYVTLVLIYCMIILHYGS